MDKWSILGYQTIVGNLASYIFFTIKQNNELTKSIGHENITIVKES